jgi:hypothetical protein
VSLLWVTHTSAFTVQDAVIGKRCMQEDVNSTNSGTSWSSSCIATDGQSASSFWCRAPFEAGDQILHFFEWQLLSFYFFHVGRPLWREDGSVIFSAMVQVQFPLYWDRRSVGQFVLVPGTQWGPWPVLISLFDSYFLLGVELPHPYPPWRQWSSPKSK